jgi:hypothetical protein
MGQMGRCIYEKEVKNVVGRKMIIDILEKPGEVWGK